MAEIGYSVTSEIVKSSLYAAVRQALYSICFNKYAEDLGKEKENLMLTRKSMQERAEKAKQDAKKIDVMVEKWLEDANALIEEVEKLEEKVKANKICCFGRCPNFIWQYHVGKQAAEKTKAMIDLNQKSSFPEFAHPATPPGMEYFSSEGFIFFESTRIAYGQLLEALKDDEVSMIGLYGMGGCGKTTLVKQVGKATEKTFNKVAFTVVSNNVDVQKIQGEIASYLDLDLKEKEVLSERARILWSRLTNGEKILIILDDVWEKLDFEAIGIPFGENHKECKVLLTSRCLGVCTSMGCQNIIRLSLLNEEEGLTLFQNHARITFDSLNGLAKEITKECKGLPIAIAAVASTLKGKSASEWEEALERLREATPMEVEEGLRNPYNCLMLSYDNLKNEGVKSLFLLCSVFPEDFEIDEEYLVRYGIGLGLFEEVSSYERARNQMSVAKNKLIDSCLLLKGNKEQCVKMHDLVRDVAMCIAKKEKKVIMGPESSGRLLTRNTTLEDNTIRYLWYDKIDKLTCQLDCPKLEFLCVKVLRDSILLDGVFRTMKDLRVLVFKHEESNRTKQDLSMAKSFQFLTNLRYLFLEGWNLGDISFLGSLKRLECLVLWNCSFEKLPDEITELSKLKLLDLYRCEIERNPYEMIGRCSQLEELYVAENEWEGKGEIPAVFLDKNNATSGLQRYRIELGHFGLFGSEAFSIKRGLCISNFDALISSAAIQDLVQRAEFLRLVDMGGCKNIIPEAIGGGMNELTELNLSRCHNIECLVDTRNPSFKLENVFSKLVKLNITWMHGLETLWRGPHVLKLNLLCSLKELSLDSCPMQTSIFTCAVAQSLVVLEEIYISDCNNVKHIVRDEEKDNDQKNSASMFPKLKELYVIGCDELEYLIPVSFAGGLVQLESLEVIRAPKLIHVFGQSSTNHEDHNQNRFHIINLPVLKELTLKYLPSMKAICPENYYPTWPSLKELEWRNCPELVVFVNKCIDGGSQVITQQGDTPTEEQQLGSNVMHDSQTINEVALSKMMQSIETLAVKYCKVEGIFQLPGHPINESDLQPLTSCLKYLHLENMKELVYICKGPRKFVSLQNLQQLKVCSCPKLKFIFSASIFGSLPQLEELYIEDCPQLEHIIEDGETQMFLNHTEINEVNHCLKNTSSEEFHNAPENPGISKCFSLYEWLSRPFNLRKLKKYEEDRKNQSGEIAQKVHDVHSYVSMFPRLRILRINKCSLLEYIFPVSFARDLVKFEKMAIYQKDQNSSNYHCQQVCFPSLTEIEIQECNNLKYLFVIFSSHELPLLNKLTIKGCSLLENVFARKESDTEDGQAIMLSKLTKLRLSKLPNLINIFKGFKWQSVDDCEVTDCPKLTSTINGNPEEEDKKIEEEYMGEEEEKLGIMNVSEQSTTNCPKSREADNWGQFLTLSLFSATDESTLQTTLCPQIVPTEYNQNNNGIPKTDKSRGDLKTQGFDMLSNPLDTQEIHQEQNINVRESIKETAKESHGHGKNPAPKKSKDLVEEAPMSNMVLMEQQQALEQNEFTNELANRTDVLSEAVHKASEKFQDFSTTPKFSLSDDVTVTPEELPNDIDLTKPLETIFDFPKHHGDSFNNKDCSDSKIKEIATEEPTLQQTPYLQIPPENIQSQVQATSVIDLNSSPADTKQYYREDKEAQSVQTQRLDAQINPIGTPEKVQELKIPPIGSLRLRESIKETAKESDGKGLAPEKSTVATSDFDLNKTMETHQWGDSCQGPEKDPRIEHHLVDDFNSRELVKKASKSDPISMDHNQEACGSNKVHLGDISSDLDLNKATNVEQKMPQISSLNKGESVKGTEEEIAQKDLTSKTPKLTISPLDLVIKVPDNDSILMEQKQPHDGKKAPKKLQLIASTSQQPSSASSPISEELVDFHGLFKIDSRRASLLDEAFAKYPHLWEWQNKFRPKFRNSGYESLADMLVFLRSETPKSLDESRREEFEKVYEELEYFQFDKPWLESIHQRVMEVQIDNHKLKQQEELKSQENALQDALNNVRTQMARVEDVLSKYDTLFDF